MISEERVEAIAAAVATSGFDRNARIAVQQQFVGTPLTYCLLDEMGPQEPFREFAGFSLFLVGSRGHCLSLTSTLDDATGVVIAQE